jgi:hypothetical protein
MFAPFADTVLPSLRAGFQVKKTMITVFFAATRLAVLNNLPQGQSFTHDYFVFEIVPAFAKEKLRFRCNQSGVTFSVHMDNSRCHNGKMATVEDLDALNTVLTKFESMWLLDLWRPEGKAQGSPVMEGSVSSSGYYRSLG